MNIVLDKVSKRFNQDWLFKDLDYQFRIANSYAITGPNGSGKTTLLKIIAGMIPCSRGIIKYQLNHQTIDPDVFYRHLTYVAPYMEVPEDLTLREFFTFHFDLKPQPKGLSITDIAASSGLEHAQGKAIHAFSSGMKQRAKLALGIFSTTPILLLDEPTTNLDESGVSWYNRAISNIKSEKILIISSNLPAEFQFCDQVIELGN